MFTDIAIIGGGASGLTAAIAAKKAAPAAKVTVIEKLPRVGRKIIAAGNGKCNLSNVRLSGRNFHGSLDAMKIIAEAPDVKAFFTDELGVLCVEGSEGRTGGLYPRSNSSSTVVNALRMRMQTLGIMELCDCEIKAIHPKKSGFTLIIGGEPVDCRRLIVAAGGYAAPSFGTDGGMMRILRDMGMKTVKICPAVAPLRVSPDSVKGLKGVRVKGEISAVSAGKVLRTEKGEIQFNENNISGICVFNLAYLFAEFESKLSLRADFAPDMTADELVVYLKKIRSCRHDLPIEELLTGAFVKNLAVFLVKKALDRPLNDQLSQVSDAELKKLANVVKSSEFDVTGCSPWQNAQSTMGGVHRDCIDVNLQSRQFAGMYLCGEILDVAGDCGGYNLQWAWSSGMLAGQRCGESLKGDRR